MAKATVGELQNLLGLVTKSLSQRIAQDMEDEVPTDAATLGVAIKLLANNGVSADPADADDLSKLRDQLAEQNRSRRTRASNVLELARNDLKQAEG